MKKTASSRRKKIPKTAPQAGSSKGSRRKAVIVPEQGEWEFEELRGAVGMPRCEVTGVNVDLHLVAYRDPDSDEPVARILGADYRHLVRQKTTVSVPLTILSVVTLRQLEKLRKIPLGTRAAKLLREWFDRESGGNWSERSRPKQLRQAPLDLPDESEQSSFRLI
jgi:hypothetical protein